MVEDEDVVEDENVVEDEDGVEDEDVVEDVDAVEAVDVVEAFNVTWTSESVCNVTLDWTTLITSTKKTTVKDQIKVDLFRAAIVVVWAKQSRVDSRSRLNKSKTFSVCEKLKISLPQSTHLTLNCESNESLARWLTLMTGAVGR